MMSVARKRGTVSVPCPRCGGPSHVLRTIRKKEKNFVVRHRECLRTKCAEQFFTDEKHIKE